MAESKQSCQKASCAQGSDKVAVSADKPLSSASDPPNAENRHPIISTHLHVEPGRVRRLSDSEGVECPPPADEAACQMCQESHGEKSCKKEHLTRCKEQSACDRQAPTCRLFKSSNARHVGGHEHQEEAERQDAVECVQHRATLCGLPISSRYKGQ